MMDDLQCGNDAFKTFQGCLTLCQCGGGQNKVYAREEW